MSDIPEPKSVGPPMVTQTPEPPPPKRSRRWLKWVLRLGAGVGTVSVIGGVVFVIWGERIVTELLLPRVATSIDKAIQRPAELGDVEGFSFWGVRLGKTVIPPTDTDQTSITVDEIEVTVGLRSLLFQQTLKSNVILTRPKVSLIQAEDGSWTDFELPEPSTAESRVKTEIQSIKITDARVTAVPYTEGRESVVERETIQIAKTDALVEFLGEDAKEISFELAGDVNGAAEVEGEEGSFNIKGEADLNLQALKLNARLQDLSATAANLVLPNTLGIRSGMLDANLTLAAALDESGALDESAVDARGTARLREGELLASALPAPVRNVQSQLLFKGQTVTVEDTSLQLNDVVVTAAGVVDADNGYDLNAQIPAVTIAEVQALADFDLPVAVDGAFRLDVAVGGELERPNVEGSLASLEPLLIDKVALDTVNADFELTGSSGERLLPPQFNLKALRAVPQAGGRVAATGLADLTDLENPQFQLSADVDLPVDNFAATYGVELPDNVVLGRLSAEVEASGDLRTQLASAQASAQWQLSDSTVPGKGEIGWVDNLVVLNNTRLEIAGGSAIAEGVVQLDSGAWQADIVAEQIAVEQFTPQASGLLTANVDVSGNLDALSLDAIQAGGTALIADAQVQLTETSAPLLDRGDWTTAFQWQGDRIFVESFDAPGVSADGTIDVDPSSADIINSLDLNVALQSLDLQPLNSFVPPSVESSVQLAGLASFNGQLLGTLRDPEIVGETRLDSLAINQLLFEPLAGPVAFSLADGGQLDLQGQQDRLQLVLRDTPGEQLPYWPASFEVRNQDFIATGYGSGRQLHADIEQLPIERLDVQPAVQYGFGTVEGLLNASVDVNLADFNNPTAEGSVTVVDPSLSPVDAEQLTANFAYANSTATVTEGELLLDDSRYLLAGRARLAPRIAYDGTLTIAEGRIEDIVPIVKKLDLTAFGVGEAPTPLGSAADLATSPVGLPSITLDERLERFRAFLAAHPVEEGDPGDWVVPELEVLEGAFSGVIAIAGESLDPKDITADFNVQGDGWAWGQYDAANEFSLRGEVNQGSVNIETAFVNAGETQVNLTGSVNLDRLDGQLSVENLPVELAELVYPLPADITGDLNLATTFDGSLTNPVVNGQASVVGAQFNGYDIEQIVAAFNYRNAVLNLESEIAVLSNPHVSTPDEAGNLPSLPTSNETVLSSEDIADSAGDNPIGIAGNIPYALPFMAVEPATNQLALTVTASNKNFEVINALTDGQVQWQSGEGDVAINVGGTLSTPLVNGRASFRNAAISSDLIEDGLTNLSGDVQFTSEQLNVQQLQANVGDGRLAISGTLPLLPSGESILSRALPSTQSKQVQQRLQDMPGLVIDIEGVPVDYDSLLQAVFDGQVLITGAALEPTVSGNISLDNGRILANQLLSKTGVPSLPTEEEIEEISPYRAQYFGIDPLAVQPAGRPEGLLDRVALQDFDLTFGDRLFIVGQPFYNIGATGSLAVNGPLSSPQPLGTIQLESGWINLFSTQFRLDRNAPNTATFTPEGGLDPFVDVVMLARVQDADITPAPPVPGGFANANVNESQVERIGDVEYVSVRAVAMGPASELSDSLTLTSTPDRDEGQLLALLGSNVFSGVTSASLTQAVGFVGGGSLATLGDRIADAVGLRSFSVFPTTDTGDDSSVGIGIGVEASAAIGNRFGVNISDVLNSSDPPQLGVQYRITDDLELRGDSNLDQTEFELEYRIKF